MCHNDLLLTSLDGLKSKLDIIDAEMARGQPPAEAIRTIELAVSALRKDLWVLLTARHSSDIHGYTNKIRVRRATELCEDVLADLHAETLPPNAPGFEVFRALLGELSRVWSGKPVTTLRIEGV